MFTFEYLQNFRNDALTNFRFDLDAARNNFFKSILHLYYRYIRQYYENHAQVIILGQVKKFIKYMI